MTLRTHMTQESRHPQPRTAGEPSKNLRSLRIASCAADKSHAMTHEDINRNYGAMRSRNESGYDSQGTKDRLADESRLLLV